MFKIENDKEYKVKVICNNKIHVYKAISQLLGLDHLGFRKVIQKLRILKI